MRIIKLLLIILLIISPFILHIWRKNVVNILNIRIKSLENEIYMERNLVMRLESRFREETSAPVIENRAREELDMRYPEEGEVMRLREFQKKLEKK